MEVGTSTAGDSKTERIPRTTAETVDAVEPRNAAEPQDAAELRDALEPRDAAESR